MLLIFVTDHFSRPLKIYSLKPQYFIAHLLIAKTQVVILYAFIPKINVKFSLNSEKFFLGQFKETKKANFGIVRKVQASGHPRQSFTLWPC